MSLVNKEKISPNILSLKLNRPEKFCKYLERYHGSIWFVEQFSIFHYLDSFYHRLNTCGNWFSSTSSGQLLEDSRFLQDAMQVPEDPTSIDDRNALLLCFLEPEKAESYLKAFPGLIFVNGLFYQHASDKVFMSRLFDCDEKVKKLKPRWGVYPKGYSEELIDTILGDFESDMLVIKPRNAALGNGVIILHRDDLESNLRYIFLKNSKLKKDKNEAFRFWRKDKYDDFIVEEFAPSNPIAAPQFKNRLYDRTMRVVFVMSCDKEVIDIEFLDIYATLPKRSIEEKGTPIQLHKSYGNGRGPYYLEVDQETKEKVEQQLADTMPILYRHLLETGG